MQNQAERKINVTTGSIDSLTFYEVTEEELTVLENGPSSSVYLNLAIALLTISISFFASIATVTFSNNTSFTVFLVIALVSLFVGIGYLITWWRSDSSYKSIITKIKKRTEKKVIPVDVKEEIVVPQITTEDKVNEQI